MKIKTLLKFKMHSEELSCNIAKPPNIANRCPLCHCDIIVEGCPNNERTTYWNFFIILKLHSEFFKIK